MSESIVFPIDIPTLALSRGIVQMMLGGLLLYLGSRHEEVHGAGWWAAGFFLNGVSLFVFPLRVPPAWDQALTVLNHMSIGASSVCFLVGFWIFGEQQRRPWILAMLLLFPILSLLIWEWLWPNARWRVLFTASGQALFLFALQFSLRRSPRSELAQIYRRLRYVVFAYILVFVWSYINVFDLLPTSARHQSDYHRTLFSVGSLLFMLSLAVGCLALQFGMLAARNADLAMVDWLTGLLNRRGFFRAVREQAAISADGAAERWVIALDVDQFKQINDRHGHAAGDRVLQALAQQLRDLAQTVSQTPAIIARVGGEEFLIVLDESDREKALGLAERIRARCADAPLHAEDGKTVRFTVSAGLCPVATGQSLEQALLRADDALYSAKRNGRNQVIIAGEPLPVNLPDPPAAEIQPLAR